MNCERFADELLALAVVRADSDVPVALREHAIACEPCAARLTERCAIDRLLDASEDVAPTADSACRIVAAALSAGSPPVRTWWRPSRGWTAAAAVLAIGLGAALLHRSAEPEPPPPAPELLARLDLLMDWDLLEEHADDLDVLAAADLGELADETEALEEDGR